MPNFKGRDKDLGEKSENLKFWKRGKRKNSKIWVRIYSVGFIVGVFFFSLQIQNKEKDIWEGRNKNKKQKQKVRLGTKKLEI